MKLDEFIDYIVEGYENSCGMPAVNNDGMYSAGADKSCEGVELDASRDAVSRLQNCDSVNRFWKMATSLYSGPMLTQPVKRKTAARIINLFLRKVLGEPNLDWGDAARLGDIYDCRVCADAIAQVYVRGIMGEFSPGVFGAEEIMSDSEIEETIKRIFG